MRPGARAVAVAVLSCLATPPASAAAPSPATTGTAAPPPPAALGPCGPIDRQYESVVLPASQLRHLAGTPLARLGAVAFRDGRPRAIPFQIDRQRDGRLVMRAPGGPAPDNAAAALADDDKLVFMPCDAGTRAPADRRDGREIVLDDPVAGTTGWVYVVVAADPPRTDRRYVAYDPAVDIVSTARYRLGMIDTLPRYFAVGLAGPLGPNLLDGLRLRAEATLHANLLRWTQDETQGRHELVGWRAGPVRVVRRSQHQVELGLGIHLTAGTAHTYFYAQHVSAPGALTLPFSPSVFFRDIQGLGGADFRDLRGWRFLAPGTPRGGFRIDGRMGRAEEAFAAAPPGPARWFALVRRGEALVVVVTMSEELAQTVPFELVYRDDETRAAPPEDVAGAVPLVGMRARDVQAIPAGRYTFWLQAFMLPGYRPGDERRLLAQLERPLGTFVSVPAGPAGAPAARP